MICTISTLTSTIYVSACQKGFLFNTEATRSVEGGAIATGNDYQGLCSQAQWLIMTALIDPLKHNFDKFTLALDKSKLSNITF